MTWVSRADRCFTAHCAVWERSEEDLRRMVWRESPSATKYYNDAFVLYDTMGYPGEHQSLPNKKQTYSVEAGNSELRHFSCLNQTRYLARLARRTRCFSRCIDALRRAVDLFVFAWNRRQRFKRDNPTLPANVRDFITPI